MKKLKPFKAWLATDREGTYAPTLHMTRREAIQDTKSWSYLRDAKWSVVRVTVKPD